MTADIELLEGFDAWHVDYCSTLPGRLVKFKYFEHGMKDLPRHGVFLGFRDQEDM